MTFHIGKSHTHNAGYLIQNQDSQDKRFKKVEADIRCCTHCEAIINMTQWRLEGAWCGRCNAPICIPCSHRMDIFGCEPWLKKLENALRLTGDTRRKILQPQIPASSNQGR